MSETYLMRGKKGQGDIAIIGMASHFPDASNLHEFWENIMAKRDSLTDITTVSEVEYWSKEDFYDPDASAADKTYGHKAGFVPAIDFDPVEFKIPPAIVDSISTVQLFSLYVAKQAMQDAGLIGQENKRVNRDRIGVILGGGGNGNTLFSLAGRQQTPYLRKIMIKSGLPEAVVDEVIDRVHDSCLEWNEDCLPGFLGNVACGRIASYFDLGGTSYMVDAACASSLAAIKAAIGELNSGSCDAVLTGGVNLENSAFSFVCFSKTPALSKSNLSRPFDRDSDGIMLGDGVGMLVLKRLEDAELDGDNIYAVIKSLEASSDGKAKSIFAPRYEGQVKALKRAYARAGLTPADIQLVEAHGTGTATGDNTELKSLRMVFDEHRVAAKSVAIGSIKSQIGHTRSAAGAASMIKATLALHHKVLPPTINVTQPGEMLSGDNGPFYVNNEPRPWLRPLNAAPRRAALSAFGFGGTNFHAILEEYEREPRGAYRLNGQVITLLFSGENPEQLLAKCEVALARFGSASSAGQALREHLAHQDLNGLQPHQARLLFVATSGAQAAEIMAAAVKQLKQKSESGWEHPLGIYYQPAAKDLDGKVVALFPGQGSQYVNMGRDIANDYPEMRQALEALDVLAANERGQGLSHVIYPTPVFSDAERQQQNELLTNTANAQPALGAISAGYFAILKENGFNPDFVAGHSYGEVTALWAAGVLSDADFYRVSLARGTAAAFAAADQGADSDAGAMLAASLTPKQREDVLKLYPGITVANDNSASQVVLAGATRLIHQLHDELKASQIHCRILPVSAAFHTEFIQSAYAPFRDHLAQINFQPPQCSLFSSATAAPYGKSPADIASLLAEQLVMPVRFRETIETLYQHGGRLFVEIGPKGVLSKLVADILNGREHSIISVSTSNKGEERLQLARAQARLLAEGVRLNALDRYARVQPPSEEKNNRLTFKLSGGFFMSDKNQERRERAMRDGDTAVVEQFITNRAPEAAPAISRPAPAPGVKTGSLKGPAPFIQQSTSVAIQKRGNAMGQNNQLNENVGKSNLDELLQAQQVMSQLHEQFQTNQKEYIQLLGLLLNKQYTLLEKFQDHQNLPAMLSSLGQSVQLLDKNLELYHANHERYFATQQSLFQSGQAMQPVVAVVAPKAAPITAQAPTMGEIAAPRQTVPVATSEPIVSQPVTSIKSSVSDPELEKQIKHFEQITEAKIIGKLVAIVSDRTGYPQDMIDVEMDLEADLGIDSIKRLEIFGAMFDAFSADTGIYHDALKNKYLETFDIEVLSNISKISAFFKQMNDEIIADIRRKNSGYAPVEAASPKDSFIENNARGQDSGQALHSLRASEDVRTETPLRTLGFVTSTASVSKAASAKKSLAEPQLSVTPAVQPIPAEEVAPVEPRVARYTVMLRSLPTPDCYPLTFASSRLWLVVDEGKTVVDEVVNQLKQQGQRVAVLTLGAGMAKNEKHVKTAGHYVLNCADEATLDAAISEIEQEQGPIDGVIYLQTPRQSVKTLAKVFSAQGYLSVETTFLLAKRLQGSLNRNENHAGYFFIVGRGDGALSTSDDNGLAEVVASGVSGLTKSLNIEWKNVFCRTLDINAQVKPRDVALILIEELQDSCTDLTEVGRGVNGERMTLALAAKEPVDTPLQVSREDVFMVTGGGRGITAQCIIEMAKLSQARFVLLGRTDLDTPLPTWAQGTTTLNERKAAAIAYLQSQQVQPTPVKIDAMLSGILYADEINQTLQEIRQAGGDACYLHCDITDIQQVSAAVAAAQQAFGRVTGIIHGAGNLADKRIEKKTLDDLRSVFDVKVKGLENLCQVVDIASLRHVMLFSSVVGYFGNAGQVDYAMANETLSKFAYLPLKGNSRLVVRAINWGPWDGGMVNDTLKRTYSARNMVIIPGNVGTRYFIQEFTDTESKQVIVGGENYKATRQVKSLPDEEQVKRLLTLEANPFLRHYVICDNPVLPATAAIGWMTRICEERFPGYQLQDVMDFSVLKGIVFDGTQPGDYTAVLTPNCGYVRGDERLAVDISITSQQGKGTVEHYQATLFLTTQRRTAACEELHTDLHTQITLAHPLYGDMRQGRMLFHGNIFQGIRQVIHIDDQDLILKCRLDDIAPELQGQFPVNSFNLFIYDVALQLPLFWLMQRLDKAGLPCAIGKIEQYATLAFGEEFYAAMRINTKTALALVVDITLHDSMGNIYGRLHNVKFTVSAALRELFTQADSKQVEKNTR